MNKKPPTDEVRAAFNVMQEVIRITEQPKEPEREKNPAAVALGLLGASKGGKARAEKLSAKKRKEIARMAAQARWGKK